MPNWELMLVKQIIDTNDIKTAMKHRISADMFHTSEALEVWDYLLENYAGYGRVPTMEMVKDLMPRVRFPEKVKEALPLLCDHIRKGHLSSKLQEYALEISQLAPQDPEGAASRLSYAHGAISQMARVGEDLTLAEGTEDWKQRYRRMKRLRLAGKIVGIGYPWEPLNDESMGIWPGEFVVLYGRMGSRKTFVLCYMAAHAYFKQHRRVLFFTKEMMIEQIQDRVLCAMAEVDYRDYRRGTLEGPVEQNMFKIAEGLRRYDKRMARELARSKEPSFVIAMDTREDGGGVSSLRGMIEQYEPDIVFVDGFYLMRDDRRGTKSRDWQNISNITADLKSLATQSRIPIVATHQANRSDGQRKGSEMRDLSYGDTVGQDADTVYRLSNGVDTTAEGVEVPVVNIEAKKTREFEIEGIIINARAYTDFSFRKLFTQDGDKPDKAKQDAAKFLQRKKLEEGESMLSLRSRPLRPEARVATAERRRKAKLGIEDDDLLDDIPSNEDGGLQLLEDEVD